MRLPFEFYQQPALTLAPLLLGKFLCRRIDSDIMRLAITEVEAYCGKTDTACHTRAGKTTRNSPTYEPGGIAYIYLCYGIHNMLNVVVSGQNEPEAVLIRGVEGIIGPGRLTKAMQIDRGLNRVSFIESDVLWLEDGPPRTYTTSSRVGISYASAEDQKKPWRFISW